MHSAAGRDQEFLEPGRGRPGRPQIRDLLGLIGSSFEKLEAENEEMRAILSGNAGEPQLEEGGFHLHERGISTQATSVVPSETSVVPSSPVPPSPTQSGGLKRRVDGSEPRGAGTQGDWRDRSGCGSSTSAASDHDALCCNQKGGTTEFVAEPEADLATEEYNSGRSGGSESPADAPLSSSSVRRRLEKFMPEPSQRPQRTHFDHLRDKPMSDIRSVDLTRGSRSHNVTTPRSVSKVAELFSLNVITVQSEDGSPVSAGLPDDQRTLATRIRSVMKRITVSPEPERIGLLARVVSSIYFESLCILVIFINAVVTIRSVDFNMEHWEDPELSKERWKTETVFVLFYITDIFLRLCIHKLYFLIGEDALWNIFDMGLVCSAVIDQLMSIFEIATTSHNITFLRVLRVLRISRVLMMLRTVRLVRELRLLLVSLVGCVGPTLLWSMILLLFLLHIFGLFYVQEMSEFLKSGDVDEQTSQHIQAMFGSVGDCMLTLWKCSTGGLDWGEIFSMLKPAGPFTSGLFIFYIWFFQGAIFNVMTGIFCERAMTAAQPNRWERLEQELRDEREEKQAMLDLCHKLDLDGDGSISITEFKHFMKDKEFTKYLSMHGLHIKNAVAFFETVKAATGVKERIELNAFVAACLKLKGGASAVDVHMLGVDMLHQLRNHHDWHVEARKCFAEVTAQLQSLQIAGLPLQPRGVSQPLEDVPPAAKCKAGAGLRAVDCEVGARPSAVSDVQAFEKFQEFLRVQNAEAASTREQSGPDGPEPSAPEDPMIHL